MQSKVNKYGDPHSITKEMIDSFEIYKELKQDDNYSWLMITYGRL